jgi:hypothetical protein
MLQHQRQLRSAAASRRAPAAAASSSGVVRLRRASAAAALPARTSSSPSSAPSLLPQQRPQKQQQDQQQHQHQQQRAPLVACRATPGGGSGSGSGGPAPSTNLFSPVYLAIFAGYAALLLLRNPYIYAVLTIAAVLPQNSAVTSLNNLVLIFYESGLFANFAEAVYCVRLVTWLSIGFMLGSFALFV